MPSINLNALHSDETELFHSPLEPKAGDIVTIRFRTAKDDVDGVVLVCGKQEFYLVEMFYFIKALGERICPAVVTKF